MRKRIAEELLAIELKKEHRYAFLSGVIRGGGELLFTPKGFALLFQHSDQAFISVLSALFSELLGGHFSVESSYIDMGYMKGEFFTVRVTVEDAKHILERCAIVREDSELVCQIPSDLVPSIGHKKSYIRGLFLACGSLIFPKEAEMGSQGRTKAGYHLEFDLNSDLVRQDIGRILSEISGIGLDLVLFRKGRRSGIYLKSADAICDVLASMGSSRTVLEIHEIIASREMKNTMNRGQNFILANIDKSVAASEKQQLAIDFIEERMPLSALLPTLQEACVLRRKYPDANLSELAALTVDGTSKSGMNHRFRKIIQIAEQLAAESEGGKE